MKKLCVLKTLIGRRLTKLIGNRPAGLRPLDCPAVQAALGALDALGIEARNIKCSSTDVNAPMSKNIPSVCVGTGGVTYLEHSLKEYFDSTDMHLGPQLALLAALAMVGLKGTKGALA